MAELAVVGLFEVEVVLVPEEEEEEREECFLVFGEEHLIVAGEPEGFEVGFEDGVDFGFVEVVDEGIEGGVFLYFALLEDLLSRTRGGGGYISRWVSGWCWVRSLQRMNS